ncbi:alpha/beta fold hydrolase [Janthinobacterium sp. UMAB-60]|uniref:alpha/beta fold hydrolase n=1 Tax=Janthinobacterium sp. UMAB-60 TaxID=1365365 RepID=UPI00214CA6A1|nr:hypothetical protein [Janthinobacterium sp. UMAB-60]
MTISSPAPTLLVLLPGMDGTARLFHRFDAALRAQTAIETQAIAYPAAPLDYAALEAFVRARLPQDRPFVVLAESFSGPLGAALRADPPPGMRALILCCAFVRNPRPLLTPLRHLLGMVPFGALPGFALRQALLAPYATPALQAELTAALAQVPPSVLRQRLRAVLEIPEKTPRPASRAAACPSCICAPATTAWCRRQTPCRYCAWRQARSWSISTRRTCCCRRRRQRPPMRSPPLSTACQPRRNLIKRALASTASQLKPPDSTLK